MKVDIFKWTIELIVDETDKVVNAEVTSGHKFGASATANEMRDAVTKTIHEWMTPEKLDAMSKEAHLNV